MTKKADAKPLFAPGQEHRITLSELADACVEAFPGSTLRRLIFDNFVSLTQTLHAMGLRGEIWINGSYTTEWPEPADIDWVFMVDTERSAEPTHEQMAYLDQLFAQNMGKRKFRNHCFFGLPGSAVGGQLDAVEYWSDVFGKSRSGVPKGIAVVTI